MYFSQRHVTGLGCLSYLVGDEASGEAVIVDPQVDAHVHVQEAADAGLRITHAVDTHVHADHASGVRAVAALTGATVHMPAEAQAAFEHAALGDGDEIRIGSVTVRAHATPGHTPEHVTLEVVDATRDEGVPYALLTGDTLFVGSVGRPDLSVDHDPEDLARYLHHSLRDMLRRTPDGTLVYPGHGAGSACGAHMSRLLQSTVGQEKIVNPYLEYKERDAFVRHVVDAQPPKPGNARGLKVLNRDGPPERLPDLHALPALEPDAFASEARSRGAIVLDAREPDAFAANHVPGSVNVAMGPDAFTRRAARIVEWGRPLLLVLPDAAALTRAVTEIARVGGLELAGWLADGMEAWRLSGKRFETLRVVAPAAAREELDAGLAQLLDVRSASEWRSGHAPEATWIPWEELPERAGELDPDTAWIVTCASGYRSSIAASVLKREGFHRVANLLGGMTAWDAAGLPLAEASREAAAQAA